MPKKVTEKNPLFAVNEFTVLFVFMAVSLVLLFFGGIFAVGGPGWDTSTEQTAAQQVIAPPAPTTAAYQAETSEVMTPFLNLALNMQKENFATMDSSMLDLVNKT